MGIKVEILPGCPEPRFLGFHVDIQAANAYQTALGFELPVGGWFDDMEAENGWMVGAVGVSVPGGIVGPTLILCIFLKDAKERIGANAKIVAKLRATKFRQIR